MLVCRVFSMWYWCCTADVLCPSCNQGLASSGGYHEVDDLEWEDVSAAVAPAVVVKEEQLPSVAAAINGDTAAAAHVEDADDIEWEDV